MMRSPVSPGSINFSHTPFDGPTVAFVYDDAFIINDWETVLIALWALGLFTHVGGGLITLSHRNRCDRGRPGPRGPNIVT